METDDELSLTAVNFRDMAPNTFGLSSLFGDPLSPKRLVAHLLPGALLYPQAAPADREVIYTE
jgi:hypothetical protein